MEALAGACCVLGRTCAHEFPIMYTKHTYGGLRLSCEGMHCTVYNVALFLMTHVNDAGWTTLDQMLSRAEGELK